MDDKRMNDLLALKVMGFEFYDDGTVSGAWIKGDGDHIGYWNPLGDDADACAVLDKILRYTVNFTNTPDGDGCMTVDVWTTDGRSPHGYSSIRGPYEERTSLRRRAICIAALKAVGVWEDQPETSSRLRAMANEARKDFLEGRTEPWP